MASSSLRHLAESDMPSLFPSGLLAAADDYVVAERLRRLMAAGDRLAGGLEGFRADYEVTARLALDGAEYTCTCGARQPCRHAAALVLAWTRRRSWFTDLDDLLRPLAASQGEDLIGLLGRLAVEPDDRLAPLRDAVAAMPAPGWEAEGVPVPPGRWVEEAEVAGLVAALAARWDAVLADLQRGRPREALVSLLGLLDQTASLAARTRDREGLLSRFLTASLKQAASLAGDPRLDGTDRHQALDRLLRFLIEAPIEVALSAAEALVQAVAAAAAAAAVGGNGGNSSLVPWVKARLLANLWRMEAEQVLSIRDPAADLRQNLMAEALAQVLLASGQDEEAVATLAQFPHLWRATSRRIAELRRLGRPEEALRAAREGLATVQGQAALDLHQWAGELLLELGRAGEAVSHLLANYLGRRGDAQLAMLKRAAEAAGNLDEVHQRLAPADKSSRQD